MPSLTPQHRSEEVTGLAVNEGLISGAIALIPSCGGVWAAMKNKTFLKSTNWQSRTAMAIMPPLFVYALASEQKLTHKMKEMANESEHARKVSEWAEDQRNETNLVSDAIEKSKVSPASVNDVTGTEQQQLLALYRKSVEESGVRIVPGDSLQIHHQVANFWQENPFKILAFLGVPTVLYIFKGKKQQQHLQLQQQIMHTRVFGQFSVLVMLLTLMGFKTHMDNQGKYITEVEADRRVNEMNQMRQDLLKRIELEKRIKQRRESALKRARDVDMRK